jgi:hypothetical protein
MKNTIRPKAVVEKTKQIIRKRISINPHGMLRGERRP